MKRPMVGLATGFGAGILLSAFIQNVALWLLLALIGFTLFLICHRRQFKESAYLVFLLAICAGSLASLTHHLTNRFEGLEHFSSEPPLNLKCRGRIITDPIFRSPGNKPSDEIDKNTQFLMQVEEATDSLDWKKVSANCLISIPGQNESLKYGDIIETYGLLTEPESPSNPGSFNYSKWLKRNHIHGLIHCRESPRILSPDQGNWLASLAYRFRHYARNALSIGIEQEESVLGLLRAMMLGFRTELDPELSEPFIRTGTMHVFAISGQHIALIAVALVVMARTARIPYRWIGLVTFPLLVLYTLATGSPPSAVRACIMSGVFILAPLFNRPADALNNLGTSALIILAWDPFQLYDPGFQLSFAVVLAIILLSHPLEQWLLSWIRPDPFLPWELVPVWRQKLVHIMKWPVRLIATSIAAWVGSIPLTIHYFNIFSPVTVFCNLLIVPLSSLVIDAGLVSIATGFCAPLIAEWFNNASWGLLKLMIWITQVMERVPYAYEYVPTWPVLVTVCFYLIVIWILIIASEWLEGMHNRRWKLAGSTGCVALFLFSVSGFLWDRNTKCEFAILDVGSGQSIFLDFPGEGKDVLLDGGREEHARRVILPFLHTRGVDQLMLMISSHGDVAHVGGLPFLADQLKIGSWWDTDFKSRSQAHALLQRTLEKIPCTRVRTGEVVRIRESAELQVLSPPASSLLRNADNNSIVLLVNSRGTRILFVSDIGKETEEWLVDNSTLPQVDVLVSGFHPREPSGTGRFLEVIKPKAAIISCGSRYISDAPPAEMVRRMERQGIVLFRTDQDGAVRISLDNENTTIHSFKSERKLVIPAESRSMDHR